MGLETGAYIGDLNAANPSGTDPKSQGDDHIRLLKSTIKATFPNVSGAMVRTHAELNTVIDRGTRAGDTWTGTHDFTGAAITVPTAPPGDAGVSAASTGFVDTSFGKIAGQAWTGTHTFPTQPPGDNTTRVATTAFATQLAFAAALPTQTVPALLFTDGATASWRTAFVGDSGSGGQLGPVPAPATGDSSKYLKGDGTWALSPSSPDVIVQDQKPNGSPGQVLNAGAVTTRDLNTIVRNAASVGSLAGNALTLPAGTWMLRGRAAWRAGSSALGGRACTILYNSTDGSEICRGEVATAGVADTGGLSEAFGVVTLAASKAIQVRTAYNATNVGDGGVGLGGSLGIEVYATLEATRLS